MSAAVQSQGLWAWCESIEEAIDLLENRAVAPVLHPADAHTSAQWQAVLNCYASDALGGGSHNAYEVAAARLRELGRWNSTQGGVPRRIVFEADAPWIMPRKYLAAQSLVSSTLAELTFHVAKGVLLSKCAIGRQLIVNGFDGRCFHVDADGKGGEIPLADLHSHLQGVDRLALIAHSDPSHVNLGDYVLCGATTPEESFDGRYVEEIGCSLTRRTCRRAHNRTIVFARELNVREVVLAGCNGIAANSGIMRSNNRLSEALLSGYAARYCAPTWKYLIDPDLFDLCCVILSKRNARYDLAETLQRLEPEARRGRRWAQIGLPGLSPSGDLVVRVPARTIIRTRERTFLRHGSHILADRDYEEMSRVEHKLWAKRLATLNRRLDIIERVERSLLAALSLTSSEYGPLFDATRDLRNFVQAGIRNWNNVQRRRARDVRSEGLVRAIEYRVTQWSDVWSAFARLHLQRSDIAELLVDGLFLAKSYKRGRCSRCGSSLTVRCYANKPESHDRGTIVECDRCGVRSATISPLSAEIGTTRRPSDVLITCSLSGRHDGEARVILSVQDKGTDQVVLERDLKGRGAFSTDLSLAALSYDVHTARAIAVYDLQLAYARLEFANAP